MVAAGVNAAIAAVGAGAAAGTAPFAVLAVTTAIAALAAGPPGADMWLLETDLWGQEQLLRCYRQLRER